jgi:hypothetical protein
MADAMDRNHQLCWRAAQYLARCWNGTLVCSEESVVGAMAVLWIPYSSSDPVQDTAFWLHKALRERGLETMVLHVQGTLAIRISVQVYNEPKEYVVLAHAVREILDLPPFPPEWTHTFLE